MLAITKILIDSWYHIKATFGTWMEPLPLAINTRATFIHQTHASSKTHAQHPAHTSQQTYVRGEGPRYLSEGGKAK